MITEKEYLIFKDSRDRMQKSLVLITEPAELLEASRILKTIESYNKLIEEYECAKEL